MKQIDDDTEKHAFTDAETKDFPTAVIASLSSGALLCDFGAMKEAAEYLMGHPILTHHFADKQLCADMRSAIAEQCPGMPIEIEGVSADNYLSKVAELERELGKTVRIRKGGEKHAFYRLALIDPSGAIVGTRPRKITLDGAGEYGAKQAAIELVRDEAHRHGLFPYWPRAPARRPPRRELFSRIRTGFMDAEITSEVRQTHRLRERGEVEAWFYAGQPTTEWPDWMRSHFGGNKFATPPKVGRWALRDEEGYFWRWFDAKDFNSRYERITP